MKSICYSLSQPDPNLCYCMGLFHLNSMAALFLCGDIPLNPYLQPFENPLNTWPLLWCYWVLPTATWLHPKSCWGALCPTAQTISTDFKQNYLQEWFLRNTTGRQQSFGLHSVDQNSLTQQYPFVGGSCVLLLHLVLASPKMSPNTRALTRDPIWSSKKFLSVGL